MITIRSLLDRIRWDSEFGRGGFTLGYHDRIQRGIISVPLARIHIEPGNRFSFSAIEQDGSVHDVPFHRVREVYRDGVLIWQRPPVKPPNPVRRSTRAGM
ncbi:MAG TPA: DUF504 domain-containing protein [Burkholderiales bacterium]|nr:DUF504 domain-containing protein [Burkholderiales bacterium]